MTRGIIDRQMKGFCADTTGFGVGEAKYSVDKSTSQMYEFIKRHNVCQKVNDASLGWRRSNTVCQNGPVNIYDP